MARLDPDQRQHEFADALLTLNIAVSRYGSDDRRAQPTARRLAVIAEIAALIANEVAERLGNIAGKEAERKFRKRLAGR